jgi:hypothetical protein
MNQNDYYPSGSSAPPPPYAAENINNEKQKESERGARTAAGDFISREERENKMREIIDKYEVSRFFSDKLQSLLEFKTLFIFDDSGSMNSTLAESPLNTGMLKATRWNELNEFAKISLEIANIFNASGGSDVYFLNRPPVKNVHHIDELKLIFDSRPSGMTPLSRTLDQVLAENRNHVLEEGKLCVILVTDGEPTNEHREIDITGFKRSLQQRQKNVFTTIVACTDEDDTMSYLDNWDRIIPRLDVVDDFRNERAQIVRTQGKDFRFSYGDYVVKSLVGSIHADLDNFDEVKGMGKKKKTKKKCVVS